MDFRSPLRVVTPTLDGDVLRVVAAAEREFSGREVHRLVGHSSENGVRKALARLVEQGVVRSRRVGASTMYSFNRDHVAAPWIEGLLGVRDQIAERLRAQIKGWTVRPVVAAMFGSAARGEARPGSDMDILLVRPTGADEDAWEAQVDALVEAATRWTGNDTRPLVIGEDDLTHGVQNERVMADVLADGIELAGSSLRRLRRGA